MTPARFQDSRRTLRALTLTASMLALAACNTPLDFDLRGDIGGSLDTSEAALSATAPRPQPDDRGIISYPNYQVAVARRGDTLGSLAQRVGLPAGELARYNGIEAEARLRAGEVIALPRRVQEPSPATGAVSTGPIQAPSNIDVTTLAGNAIERAAPTPAAAPAPAQVITPAAQPQTGTEPIRHKVERGESAFIIARKYGVSVSSLAEWNGLDREFRLREGQYLLIPVANTPPPARQAPVPQPGTGSPTPTPPSATKPLPQETPAPAAAAVAKPETPKLETSAPAANSGAAMLMPVSGAIIRDFAKGRNEGIDISAAAGTSVRAAAAGRVAAITSDADRIPIVVIKHPNNLLTVYANMTDLTIKKDDEVARGQTIGKVRAGSPSYVHFEVREGFEAVDPNPYLR